MTVADGGHDRLEADRWASVQSLFHRALEHDPTEWDRFLDTHCSDDPDLRHRVATLLSEDRRTGGILDQNLGVVADALLDDPTLLLRLVGRYRVQRVLGHGGMGVVYLAERDDLGSKAAIKVLRDASLSPSRRDRFLTEQRTLAQLNHPNIAKLLDAGSLPDGTPYFVMEYVEGVRLPAFCEAGHLALNERLRLFRAVCEAVRFAHQALVVHRDLKPSNILVTNEGEPKLLDFGIAKHLAESTGQDQATRTGLRLMTLAYAAPEQLRGEPTATYTDVYALGVNLYELVAGHHPFPDVLDGMSRDLEAAILDREPVPPSVAVRARRAAGKGIGPSASGAAWSDLDVLCLTAMHKDPRRRYRSVDALIGDIDRLLAGRPLEARPDTMRYRVGKFVRRNARGVTAAATVAVAVVALVVFFTFRLAAARDAAVEEAARTQRVQGFLLNLLSGGDEEAGPADSLRVVTLIDRGVAEADALDGVPEIQAELYQTLGTIYRQMGRFPTADTLLRRALDRYRELRGERHSSVAEGLLALAALRMDQAEFDEAETMTREALDIARGLPDGHPAVAEATMALGKIRQEQGRFDESAVLLDEVAVRLAATGGSEVEMADALAELANTHYYAGHLDVADSLNRRVLALDSARFGPGHPRVADGLINLGAIAVQRGQYEEAEPYYRAAVDRLVAFYGREHPVTASGMKGLGQDLVYQGRYDEALEWLNEALAVQERTLSPNHPRLASTLSELATVALQRDDYDTAERYFRRIVDIYRAAHGERHYFVAIALSNLASVYLDKGEYARAEPIFRDVVARFTESRSANDVNTAIARIKLGRTLHRLRRPAAAEVELRAGYEVLMQETAPSVSWVSSARRDLVEVYEALGRTDDAERFRAELAAADSSGPGS